MWINQTQRESQVVIYSRILIDPKMMDEEEDQIDVDVMYIYVMCSIFISLGFDHFHDGRWSLVTSNCRRIAKLL